jgi:Fic family protein
MFKEQANYAGGYRFVDPDLVEGTLRRGFNRMSATIDPMSRAMAMMVLVTECHPFDDGNGRIARLMSNAELDIAGQVRIVIPTSFRTNHLASLTALSNGNGDGQSLHAVMDFAQKWVSHVDWATFERADEQLRETHAYLDPAEAEGSGRRLRLPT